MPPRPTGSIAHDPRRSAQRHVDCPDPRTQPDIRSAAGRVRSTGAVTAARRLTERIPALYPLAVRAHQLRQHLRWRTDDRVYARTHATDPLEHRVKQHNSLLLRELSADEMRLQHNKVINLRLASAETDGILIRPGESFSFNRTVGNCTRARGFVEGMRLTNGRAIAGVGGGICQLANLIHWMVLHSPLTVTARSEHSFDPFPDKAASCPGGGRLLDRVELRGPGRQ